KARRTIFRSGGANSSSPTSPDRRSAEGSASQRARPVVGLSSPQGSSRRAAHVPLGPPQRLPTRKPHGLHTTTTHPIATRRPWIRQRWRFCCPKNWQPAHFPSHPDSGLPQPTELPQLLPACRLARSLTVLARE